MISAITRLAAVLAVMATSATAQEYPSRPVQVIIAYAAGGGVDVMGRAFLEGVAPLLGQQFVVVNKDGAGGVLGFTQLAQAKPDGYTLGFGPTSPITGAPNLVKNIAYGFGDFEFVCQVFENVFTISVPKTSSITSLKALLDDAKAKPGQLTYGHSGVGSVPHVSMEGLAWKAGVSVTHVPFRGDGQLVPQLLSGQLAFGVPAVSSIVQHDLRVLAVFGDKRHSAYRDAPVVTELGFPYMPPGLNGLYAPKGTPADVLGKLERGCEQSIQGEKFRQVAGTLYQPIVYLNRADFTKRAQADYDFKGEVIRAVKISAD
jgi:tripartite-type tricarboxylate transporter receptor subunit TctC